MNNPLRNGNFTSSEIVALMSFDRTGKKPGVPFWTYIAECNMERRLGRALCDEVFSKATAWGKLVEGRVHDLLGTDYKLCSQETIRHSEIDCWVGSPDGVHIFEEAHLDAVIDYKCPQTLKSFCQLVQPYYDGLRGIEYFNAIREGYTDSNGQWHDKHKDGEKFYWQLVSNSCIIGSKYAELIVYAPYKSELADIRTLSVGNPEYYSIWSSSDDQLPYLIEGGYYKNLNVMRFEVPQEDKDALRDRVLLAKGELIQSPKLVAA